MKDIIWEVDWDEVGNVIGEGSDDDIVERVEYALKVSEAEILGDIFEDPLTEGGITTPMPLKLRPTFSVQSNILLDACRLVEENIEAIVILVVLYDSADVWWMDFQVFYELDLKVTFGVVDCIWISTTIFKRSKRMEQDDERHDVFLR